MPNWCENDLYISGPGPDVAALLHRIGADEIEPRFDFNAVVPYPARFAERDAEFARLSQKERSARFARGETDGFNSGGKEWRDKYWGVKWNAFDVLRRDYEHPCITFQTPWGPPTPVIVVLHKLFPTCSLRLEYFERGCEECGGFSCLSRDDWDETDGDWAPGNQVNQWSGRYLGHRGG